MAAGEPNTTAEEAGVPLRFPGRVLEVPPGFFLLGEKKGKLEKQLLKIKDQGLLGFKQNSLIISISDFQIKKGLHSEDQVRAGLGELSFSPQKCLRVCLRGVSASRA